MSTNATIRISKNLCTEGETQKKSYVHWDGYPKNMLPLLNDHYNTLEKAKELIALGNLSSLCKRVKPEPGENHSFESQASGVTVAYHRDRGEDLEWCDINERHEYNYKFNGTFWELA